MKILCSCGFFVPFLSVSIRVYILKEGDRMGHKDDVLGDDCMINQPLIRKIERMNRNENKRNKKH